MPRKIESDRPWDSYDYLFQKYVTEGISTVRIAAGVNTFPNTIRRALKKHGIELKTKSNAQKLFLEDNPHPMAGRERTEEEKKKISSGIQENWNALTPQAVEARKEEMSARARIKWDLMSEEEKSLNLKKMQRANRSSTRNGSKNENTVAKLLKEAGYNIIQRTNDFSPQNAFEIDIVIAGMNVAIEWDGAAHFAPIYGEGCLAKTVKKDNRKDLALLGVGWTLIRCRDHSTSPSLAFCQRATAQIIEVIKNGARGIVHNLDAV